MSILISTPRAERCGPPFRPSVEAVAPACLSSVMSVARLMIALLWLICLPAGVALGQTLSPQ
ncbi:MAG: hypothetical protein M3371_11415, partial [Acidobacteriota bacterium]|nr:hypothetical protein [Acidobacteriota bacterium]